MICFLFSHDLHHVSTQKANFKSFYQPQISNVCSNQPIFDWTLNISRASKYLRRSLLSCRKLQHLHLIFVYIDTIMVLSHVFPSPKNHRPQTNGEERPSSFFPMFFFAWCCFSSLPEKHRFLLPEKSTARSVVASIPWLTVAIMLGTLEEVCSHT